MRARLHTKELFQITSDFYFLFTKVIIVHRVPFREIHLSRGDGQLNIKQNTFATFLMPGWSLKKSTVRQLF